MGCGHQNRSKQSSRRQITVRRRTSNQNRLHSTTKLLRPAELREVKINFPSATECMFLDIGCRRVYRLSKRPKWRWVERNRVRPSTSTGERWILRWSSLFHLWAEALHVCSTVGSISSQKCWKCYCSNEYFFRNDRFYSNEHSTLLLFKCKLFWYRVN